MKDHNALILFLGILFLICFSVSKSLRLKKAEANILSTENTLKALQNDKKGLQSEKEKLKKDNESLQEIVNRVPPQFR